MSELKKIGYKKTPAAIARLILQQYQVTQQRGMECPGAGETVAA